jgi:hypothetical protein
MRTWRQGVLGIIALPISKTLYLKCLKYPLALFYENELFETDTNQKEIFSAFVELSVFPSIERYGAIKLTKAEKKINHCFSMNFETNVISIDADNKIDFDFPSKELINNAKIQDLYNSLDKGKESR